MRILVTGSGGYIGRKLVDNLATDDSYSIVAISRSQLPGLNPKIKNHLADLSIPGFENSLPENIDTVIHLAQSNRYRNFPDGAEDMFAVNIHSTQLLLEWSRKSGVKKFIFASTGSIYKQQNKLLKEDDICEPAGYYGASKYAAEQLIKPYSGLFNTAILRIFGVYGPGQKNMTIPNIIDKIINGNEVTLANGEGLHFTPLYVDDCIEMLKLVIMHGNENSGIYNISGNEVTHLGKVVELTGRILNVVPVVKLTGTEPSYMMGDSGKFNKDYNFIPATGIINGLGIVLK